MKPEHYKKGYHGKVKKVKMKEIELLSRKVIVRVSEYESGVQRVHAFFSDKNLPYLRSQNVQLRKQIQKLETQLKKKK